MLRRWELFLILIGLLLSIAAAPLAAVHHGTSKTAPHGFSAVRETPSTTDTVPAPVPEPTTTTTVAPEPIIPSVEHWQALHQCEQPDSWTIDGVFGNGLHGGGGLGISNAAWNEWGGQEFAQIPGQATPAQQMLVASRGWLRYGAAAWACKVP